MIKELNFLGDVRDYNSLRMLLLVLIMFSCCCIKTSANMRIFPMEAVKTNIIGAENVMNICHENQVKMYFAQYR